MLNQQRHFVRYALAASAAALMVFAQSAQAQTAATKPAVPKSRADCERINNYSPNSGQSGKDVVWVPTPDALVSRMLTMAKVTPQDYVIDLGAGDGKIAIAAAKEFGATSVGIEYNPDMAKLANCMVQVEGVGNKTKIINGDIFKEDFSKATVVTMYLLPQLNLCVRHRILGMKPGTRVTSNSFNMAEWEPDQTDNMEYRTAYLWIVPAKVGGNWNFREQGGNLQFNVALNQNFQKVTGDVSLGNAKQPLVGTTLQGDQIRFAFNDAQGVTRNFVGTVRGNEVSGTLRAANGAETKVSGTLQGAPQAAKWAEMASGCDRYYGK